MKCRRSHQAQDAENYKLVAEQFEGTAAWSGWSTSPPAAALPRDEPGLLDREGWRPLLGGGRGATHLGDHQAVGHVARQTGIMRLVGASNLFIQLPFKSSKGVIAALTGAILAWPRCG